MFFRLFQHLLPRGHAWKLFEGSFFRKFFQGIAAPFDTARDHLDAIYLDLDPSTTTRLAEWEIEFGLRPGSLGEEQRRQALDAEWKDTDGQGPDVIQERLQAAGFNVYVHEWWETPAADPPVARDPNDFLSNPFVGTTQCGEPLAQCGEPTALCNEHPGAPVEYLVNDFLTSRAPPPLPTNPALFSGIFYIGAETFPDRALVPTDRRLELSRLILSLRPQEKWVGLLIDFVESVATEDGFAILTEGGEEILAE